MDPSSSSQNSFSAKLGESLLQPYAHIKRNPLRSASIGIALIGAVAFVIIGFLAHFNVLHSVGTISSKTIEMSTLALSGAAIILGLGLTYYAQRKKEKEIEKAIKANTEEDFRPFLE